MYNISSAIILSVFYYFLIIHNEITNKHLLSDLTDYSIYIYYTYNIHFSIYIYLLGFPVVYDVIINNCSFKSLTFWWILNDLWVLIYSDVILGSCVSEFGVYLWFDQLLNSRSFLRNFTIIFIQVRDLSKSILFLSFYVISDHIWSILYKHTKSI